MRQVTMNVFTFSELNDKAKQKAIAWYNQNVGYPWNSENLESIKAFCEIYNVTLSGWSVSSYDHSFNHDAENRNFRGLKLKNVDCESYPTGFWLDADLSVAFYDHFKRTGDALGAFTAALDSGFSAWSEDIKHHYTENSIAEFFDFNEFEFDENGNII